MVVVNVNVVFSRVRERDLERLFDKYGPIARLDMKSGYAFVEYNDPRDGDDAVRYDVPFGMTMMMI